MAVLGDNDDSREVRQKMYVDAEHPERCPILLYEDFRAKRPEGWSKPNSPFYLAVNSAGWMKGRNWFKQQAMGRNTLNDFMKNLCQSVGIPGRKTNHSIRKTTVTRLMESHVPPTYVQKITGHKNVDSLKHYCQPSKRQHKEMLGILQGRFSRFGDPQNDVNALTGSSSTPSTSGVGHNFTMPPAYQEEESDDDFEAEERPTASYPQGRSSQAPVVSHSQRLRTLREGYYYIY